MQLTIALDYTPQGPQTDSIFTETSFTRRSVPFTFNLSEIGIALVDLWNCGWEDGPVSETLGAELSLEHGISHAQRKRQIIETVISPAVAELRSLGVQIFHCNHALFLERYPEWLASTTATERAEAEAERAQLQKQGQRDSAEPPAVEPSKSWPPPAWVSQWRKQHETLVYGSKEWMQIQGTEVYPEIDIPAPVKPVPGDVLVFSGTHFHRWLRQKRIRALFYLGFETNVCVITSPYGMAKMQDYGYLCTIVRDGTTTIEAAETLDGLYRTRVEIIRIEEKWGYSVDSQTLLQAVRTAHRLRK